MTVIYINGVAMPPPTKYEVGLADIHAANSGRTDGGNMNMEIVRKDVATIEVGWSMLTYAQLQTVTSAIRSDEVTVRYLAGDYNEATMYRGDRNISLRVVDENLQKVYWDISFSLVEC